jgi:hypothetical protein
MSPLLPLLSMQLPNWQTDDLTLRQLASGDDAKAVEAQRILKNRAKRGEHVHEPELIHGGYAQRLCVVCDCSIPADGPNTCHGCLDASLKQFPKE